MPNITIQARVTPELKRQAEAVFSSMGMSTAEAIRIFLKQVVNSGGLPFQPTAKRPNAKTLAAMMEIENSGGQLFQTTDDLFADWNS